MYSKNRISGVAKIKRTKRIGDGKGQGLELVTKCRMM
jgi:hypothetical protein